jgi:Zn-dependent protease
MEPKELRDIVISAVALAFIFVYQGFDQIALTLALLPVGLLVVSTSFVLHELGHRALAQKYKFHAEYQMWPQGLILALVIALATNGAFIFAAPGAVVIMPRADLWGRVHNMSRKAYGIISAAGPLINIALAAAFLATAFVFDSSTLMFGASINAWLALFNMLPLGPLDGTKIFMWSKALWLGIMAAAIALFAVVQLI